MKRIDVQDIFGSHLGGELGSFKHLIGGIRYGGATAAAAGRNRAAGTNNMHNTHAAILKVTG
ncbi:hypothetical protein GCM10023190_12900 [Enteractinococcus fodinae]